MSRYLKCVVLGMLLATAGGGVGCRGVGPMLLRVAVDATIIAATSHRSEKRPAEEETGPRMVVVWLHRTNGRIRPRKVLAIARVLDLSNQKLTQVVGLEKLVWLRKLNLSGNRIYSIDVSKLFRLKHLDLSHNSIRRLNGLERLTELEVLHLGSNGLRWIAGLKGLCTVKQINLTNNPLPVPERQRVQASCPSAKFLF